MDKAKKKATDVVDNVVAAQSEIEEVLRRYGPFFTLADAARRMAMPLPTLTDAVRNGRVKSLRMFGKYFVRLKDVETLKKAQQQLAKKTLSESLAEIAAIGDERDVPDDFAINFRHYLYGHDKVA
jgi:hypothetical protein